MANICIHVERPLEYIHKSPYIVNVRNRSCGKVMFSQVSVNHSVHGGGVGIPGPFGKG